MRQKIENRLVQINFYDGLDDYGSSDKTVLGRKDRGRGGKLERSIWPSSQPDKLLSSSYLVLKAEHYL